MPFPKKLKKWIVIIISIIAFYTLLGFLILPAAIKYGVPKIVQEKTEYKNSV